MSTPWTNEDLRALNFVDLSDRLSECSEKAMASINPWTAFEIEVLLTDLHGTTLVNACDEVIKHNDTGYLAAEFQPYMLEGRPRRDQRLWTARNVRQAILDVATTMNEACERANIKMTPIASGHSWNAGRVTVRPENPDHRRMVDETMPAVGLGAVATGFQFHGCNPCSIKDTRYWKTLLLLQQYAPYLLALSANSPRVEDHIFGSVRYLLSRSIWSFKLFGWTNFADFAETIYAGLRRSVIRGPHNLHGWVKPCVGSLEQRICDTPGSIFEMWALTALMHALHVFCFEHAELLSSYDVHKLIRESNRDDLYLALENAAVFGLSNLAHPILSPYESRRYPMRDVFKEIEARVGPKMSSLGYSWERDYFFNRMVDDKTRGENGATRLVRWQKKLHDPKLVLDAAHKYFLKSLDDARKIITQIE